ncbi:MAG: phosphoribosylformylglycinamidine synthase subunit PurS [Xenococcus sp. MO_188.B8]|nr:phosphoribosylformylglycinamidine synthase subunit PurS [Xenococcus sp. MO_188.B8]
MSNHYHARIYVTLRPSVLDPAGTAVESGLNQMGYQGVTDVRIGKYIEMGITANDDDDATTQLDQMCDRLLANPVIENYCFEIAQLTRIQ